MQVIAFAPSLKAVLQDAGGVTTDGFPMTSAQVASFPAQITVPLVLAVYTQGGTDHDLRPYVVARSRRRVNQRLRVRLALARQPGRARRSSASSSTTWPCWCRPLGV